MLESSFIYWKGKKKKDDTVSMGHAFSAVKASVSGYWVGRICSAQRPPNSLTRGFPTVHEVLLFVLCFIRARDNFTNA